MLDQTKANNARLDQMLVGKDVCSRSLSGFSFMLIEAAYGENMRGSGEEGRCVS